MPVDVVTPGIQIRQRGSFNRRLAITHLKLGIILSPTFSIGLLRGFAYCPAMRPIRTTGVRAPQMRIREKERISPIFAVMFSYERG